MAGEHGYGRPMADTEPIEQLMASLQRLGRLLASRQVASRISTAAGVDVSQQGAALLRVLLRARERVGDLARRLVDERSRAVHDLDRPRAERRGRRRTPGSPVTPAG